MPARWLNILHTLFLASLAGTAGCVGSTPWLTSSEAGRKGESPSARAAAELAEAHDLYRKGEYAKAQYKFHALAENKSNSPQLAEEARFYEADCLRMQSYYPKAVDTYNKTLIDFPNGAFREQACQRMFDIANYWLDDTRAEMAAYEEQKAGKRWVVVPAMFHVEKSKPFFDQEGRALQALENVHMNQLTGPLDARALYLLGRIHFYRGNYTDADHYFTTLATNHRESELAPEAIELAIISKHLSVGGSDYDGRKSAEALTLVHQAKQTYPQMNTNPEKAQFLDRQLIGITLAQAEKDFKIAEFYRRTDHPGSAYFCYEIVKRRYPGTKYAEQAHKRMEEIYAEATAKKSQPATGTIFDLSNWGLGSRKKSAVNVPDPNAPGVASATPGVASTSPDASGRAAVSDVKQPTLSNGPAPMPRPIPADLMPR